MSWETALDRQIHDYLPDLKWAADEPMAKHTSFRIGGPAKRMAFPKTREQLVVLMGFLQDAGVKPLLIGNGTNLLVADKGLDTVVIDTSAELSHIELTDEGEIAADAGVSLAKLALFAWKNGLTGLEFAHGIPGTLGGGVVMNAGAYGGELKDVVTEVTALYPDSVKVLTPAELDFSYRHSVFSAGEGIVLGAKVKLESGDPDAIKAKMDDLMARRKASQPLELPSAGSTFKRPTGYYAGPLIEGCGLKGCRVGGAEVSSKHAGFVVNVGGATCADVLALIEKVQKTVYDALAPLGEDYRKVLQQGFDNRWIDVYENAGKRSGAYSAGARVHPYVLLNYTGTLDSQFTLAHEMGHAMHSYLSNHNQNPLDADYVIFVAEVASTCNEALLMEYLLGKTTDKKERAYLINHFLEQFRTTLYRQTMFAEFELNVGRMAQEGTSLTPEVLNAEYRRLNRLYFGENIVLDHEIDTEWMRIPHFYYNYYVFQYATGYAAAIALSRRILREGAPAVKDYIGFLSGGCSKSPIDLLKGAGVDMSTTKPVEEALSLFGELIGEMEELLK